MTKVPLNILAQAEVDKIRTEKFLDKDHLVIPVVALVEGIVVPSNSGQKELALADEFAKFPQGWDGRPVFLNHPKVNGKPVPGNSPTILESQSFGLLFNTTVDGKKLKTEAWLNLERVEELGEDVKEIVEVLQSGQMVEVSTGLFADVEQQTGTFKGQKFNSIWRGVVPDHLAILAQGMIGACSVEDGCGAPRTNSKEHFLACASCKCGGGDAVGEHVVIIDVEDEKELLPKALEIKQPPVKHPMSDAWNKVKDLLVFRNNKKGMSVESQRRAIKAALQKVKPNEFIDVMDLIDNTVIYQTGFDGTFLQQEFSITEKGKVVLKGEPLEVRPEVTFVPVQVSTKELSGMSKEKIVDALIANEATHFVKEDRDWLLSLEEEKLKKLEPLPPKETKPDPKTNEVKGADGNTPDPKANAGQEEAKPKEPVTVEDYLKGAPPQISAVLSQGLKMHQESFDALVKSLKENRQCQFTEEELKVMSLEQLKKLSTLSQGTTFSAQGGSIVTRANAGDDDGPPPPLKTFSGPKKPNGADGKEASAK